MPLNTIALNQEACLEHLYVNCFVHSIKAQLPIVPCVPAWQVSERCCLHLYSKVTLACDWKSKGSVTLQVNHLIINQRLDPGLTVLPCFSHSKESFLCDLLTWHKSYCIKSLNWSVLLLSLYRISWTAWPGPWQSGWNTTGCQPNQVHLLTVCPFTFAE